jgi:hypothetical protein
MKNILYISSVGTSGYSVATRNYIFNYLQNGYNVTYIPTFIDNSLSDDTDPISVAVNNCKETLYDKYDYVIINSVADSFEKLYNDSVLDNVLLKNKGYKLIFQTVWETNEIPVYWVDIMNNPTIDEVWVPSNFNKTTFEKKGVKNKIVVKKYLSYNFITPIEKNEIVIPEHTKYGSGDITKTFNFYSISSWTDRKNYKNTIREFCKTFTSDDDVSYLIKTTLENYTDINRNKIKKEFEDIIKEFPNHPTFVLFLENYNNFELNNIHNLGDCYYLLSRGEGLGYAAYDAFLNNKPVIVTGYGGHTEYFPKCYPYFVDYALVKVDGMKTTKWYGHNHYWAEPDYNHAKKLLKSLYITKNEF